MTARPSPGFSPPPKNAPSAERLDEVQALSSSAIAGERYQPAMTVLATLRGPVDEFFSKVTVNCEDGALRANRLRLLARIRDTLNAVADFSLIEG